jgi:cell division protein FtsI/penicillin-binding protein 2
LDATTIRNFTQAAVVVLCLGQCAAPSRVSAPDLHAQATAAALDKKFPSPDLSFLVLDERGQVMAQRWDEPASELPVGSLTKPFLAVAYGRTHDSFPQYRCEGKQTCWLRRGHGTLGIRDAIAFSCNSYFHQLVAGAAPGFAKPTIESFGLTAQAWSADKHGLGGKAAPLALVHAYLELAKHSQEEAVVPVLKGMELSAQKGTAAAAGIELRSLPALAKTGTAPCTHRKKAPGDGFALVMAPADHPRVVLLVRVHGKPGSVAAGVAGRMVAAIESEGPAR